jgi:alkanesulfonate monooxygenase
MVDALWFIPGHGDGPYLGTDTGKRAPTHEYLAAVARAIDSLGYYGALIPTGFGCEDSWVIASSLFPLTQRMKFLIAFRPGSLSPTLAARMAATMDRMSGGRLLLNIITGGDPVELKGDGTFESHDERYAISDEFLTIFRAVMQGEKCDFEGKYEHVEGARINFPPAQKPYPPLYFGGSSDAGIAVAAKHIDVYLSLIEPPEMIKPKLDKAREEAAKHGREIGIGIRTHIIARDTMEEAWKAADNILKYVTPESIAAHREKMARFDSVGQSRMMQLSSNSFNGRDALEVYPNLWAGFSVVNKGLGTAIVGTPEIVAERLQQYVDLGADKFILSSYPHLEECYRVAETVLPLCSWWNPDHNRVTHRKDTLEWQ